MPKRKAPDAVIQPDLPKRHRNDPQLVSLEVVWRRGKGDLATLPGFHITAIVEASEKCNDIEVTQYVKDGMSIKSGYPHPETLAFRRTSWMRDDRERNMDSPTSAEYDDTPGYDATAQITAQTDFKYVFGAYWEVSINGMLVATTTPLFGLIKGKHPRRFKPDAEVVATWDIQGKRWVNRGELKDHFPRWWTYPEPKVDNKVTRYRGR